MVRIALTLCLLIGSTSWAMAQDSAMAATPETTIHTLLGAVVKSFSWADADKGTKSEIIVKDAKGKTINIYITSTTTLWDKDAKAIMPEKIAPKTKINIIYLTTAEGINIGKSIKILK